MALKKSQKSLDKWTKEDWGTASGKPSIQGKDATGEAYMPKSKRQALKSSVKGRQKLARANAVKRKATKAGKQFSKHGLHKNRR